MAWPSTSSISLHSSSPLEFYSKGRNKSDKIQINSYFPSVNLLTVYYCSLKVYFNDLTMTLTMTRDLNT